MIKREDVIACYYDLLGRIPENEAVIQHHLDASTSLEELRARFTASPEYQAREGSITSTSPLEELRSIEELDALMVRAAHSGDEEARIDMLCKYKLADPDLKLPPDPFSTQYRTAVLAFYHMLRGGQDYDPARDERFDLGDLEDRARRPSIYRTGGSRFLGMFLEAIGQILQVADVAPGTRVIEYGPGDGQIALTVARLGCEVTVVDIEPRYLAIIQRQADMLGCSIRLIEGSFTAPVDGSFDLVIFFEAFHHALEHQAVLASLQGRLAIGGKIIFAGEPIIAANDYWAPTIPYAWGLRLDALSLSAVRNYGWMELGYQEDYFYKLLARTGWRGRKIASLTNARGTCYVAER